MHCEASVGFFWVTTSGGNGYARSDASSRNQAVLVISDDADHCVPFTEEHVIVPHGDAPRQCSGARKLNS